MLHNDFILDCKTGVNEVKNRYTNYEVDVIYSCINYELLTV